MKRTILLLLPLLLAGCGRDQGPSSSSQARQPTRQPSPTVSIQRATRTPTAAPTPPPPQLCLVTRERGVGPNYVPPDLVPFPADLSVRKDVRMRRETAEALLQLLTAARAEGQNLLALSGYRSYNDQKDVLEQETRAFGTAQAEQQVAPPGHSEHQLGVAVDVTTARKPYDLDQSFGGEPEGQWLAANAPRFGFVVSYPAGKTAVTGYVYEPWHIRYVGIPLAQQIAASGLTLTEYLPLHNMDGCPTS